MKERPILFNGEMVRAVLDGRKTQTRRLMKPQPRPGVRGDGTLIETHPGQLSAPYSVWESKNGGTIPLTEDCFYRTYRACPYGQMGDRLWVRETFYQGVSSCIDENGDALASRTRDVRYVEEEDRRPTCGNTWQKRPSIHMPRWASRILLEITDIRVERVQDTSYDDMTAEGVDTSGPVCGEILMLMTHTDNMDDAQSVMHRDCWADLWDTINEEKGFGWDVNPWVWVVEFKVITT